MKYALLLANAMFAEIEKLAIRAEKLTPPEKAEELRTMANTISEKVKTMGYTKELTEVARNVSGLKKTLDSVRAEISSMVALKRQEEIEKEKRKNAKRMRRQSARKRKSLLPRQKWKAIKSLQWKPRMLPC